MPGLEDTEAGQRVASERQINKFGAFLEEHADSLEELRQQILTNLTGGGRSSAAV